MNSSFLRMARADPRLTNSLQEAVLLLCKAGLKYDSSLSVDCLLAVTIDQKEVFVINIKESVTCLEDDCSPQCLLKDSSQIESKNSKESSDGTTLSDLRRMSSPSGSQTREKAIDCSSVGSGCFAVSSMPPVNMTTAWCSFNPEFSHKESEGVIDSQFEPRQRLSFAATPVISTFLHEKSDDGGTESKESCLQNQDGNTMSSDDQPDIELNSKAGQHFPQIKIEPLDEYRYQVLEQCSADVHTRTRDCQDGTIDYLPFSAYAYSAQRLLQAQMAAAVSQNGPTAPSSSVQNSASITFPRRQQRTLENSLCVNCGTNTTTVWRRSKEGHLLCNACGCYFKLHKVHRPLSLLRDNIRRRSRRQQVYRRTMGIPLSSTSSVPFPARWNR